MEINKLTIVGDSLSHFLPGIIEVFTSQFHDAIISKYESMLIIAFEEFYFRLNSNLLTVVVVNFREKNKFTIEILSGGGSQGLLGVSWGAEKKSVSTSMALVAEVCEKYSFSIQNQE